MIVEFKNAKPLSEEQIQDIEKVVIGFLPLVVKDWYMSYGGSNPEIDNQPCLIKIILDDGWELENSIDSIDNYTSLLSHIKYSFGKNGYLKELTENFELGQDYVEYEVLFPVAVLPNGAVYTAISGKHKGKVYSVDNGDFGIVYHSASLQDFQSSFYI